MTNLSEEYEKQESPFQNSPVRLPLTGHFSNPFFANVDELLALRDSLKDEGLLDRLTAIPAITERGASSPIPYRP